MLSEDLAALVSDDEDMWGDPEGVDDGTNGVDAPSAGRRLFELPGCLDAEFTVMQPRVEQIFYFEISIPIWPGLAVVGFVDISLEFEVRLAAQACITSRKISLTLKPSVALLFSLALA